MDRQEIIQILYHAMIQNDTLSIEKSIETVDFDDLADTFIEEHKAGKLEDIDLLSKLVSVMHYLENETSISSPMSDEKYDILVEIYQDVTGDVISGTFHEVPSKEDGTSYHRYPELRGTLNKVHFLYKKDIPEHDSRKSFEWFWDKLVGTNLRPDLDLYITVSPKYDGHSVVFEMNKTRIEKALTRYKTELNLGKDITHIFDGLKLFQACSIPDVFKKVNTYGVKTEVYMTQENLERFKKDMGDDSFNQRSAVASILNRKPGSELKNGLEYLSIQPFQIASSVKTSVPDKECWRYVGKVGGYFYSYIAELGMGTWYKLSDKEECMSLVKMFVEKCQSDQEIPTDGIVISVFNQDIIDKLGRKNDVNQFQVAYKFPTGTGRTTLKKITFPIGPCAGTVTPLAEVEPIIINGRLIKSVSLSNMDKLERLDLRLGDEVIINYDIIPKLRKDSTCKKGKGPKIKAPTACPVCGGELSETYRCTNPYCDSKIAGRIYNFITKLRIPNIGIRTVERMVAAGVWESIQSLYQLPLQKDTIVSMRGFGETSYNNIKAGVYSRMELYPHEVMAALGIPDIAEKTMKKIFKEIDILKITNPDLESEEAMETLTAIKGIGKKKAEKLVTGIKENQDLIQFILAKVTIKPYEEEDPVPEPETNVVFTGIRDKNFESFLRAHGIGVSETISGKTSAVITKSYLRYRQRQRDIQKDIDDELFRMSYGFTKKTKKMEQAEEKGIPIIDLNEYKKKVGYGGTEDDEP